MGPAAITAADAAEATIPSASGELFDDFGQARILASVRQRLFGRGPSPRIGRFEIERRLGAGGMGEVDLAVDPELARLDEAVGLRREALAAAEQRFGPDHPNIATYAAARDPGRRPLAALDRWRLCSAPIAGSRRSPSDWRAGDIPAQPPEPSCLRVHEQLVRVVRRGGVKIRVSCPGDRP